MAGEPIPAARTIPSLRSITLGRLDPDDWAGLTRAARGQMVGRALPRAEAFAEWVRWIGDRPRRHLDAVVAITGAEGLGKSTLAIRLAMGLDPLWKPSDTCYTALDVLNQYRTAYRGKVILYDEGVRGLLAGETFSPEQVALVRALALVRESGAILIICVPSIFMLAKQIRSRRATVWFHVTRRGAALAHVRDERLTYQPPKGLGLTVSPIAPRLSWAAFAANSRVWKAYVARKNAMLSDYLAETAAALGNGGDRKAAKAARQKRWRDRKRQRESGASDPAEGPEGPPDPDREAGQDSI